eukprot:1360271-Amphidinium_carterae.1
MEVDEAGENPHLSPPPSPHAPTEVPAGDAHVVGANPDVHPWGPPLAEEDEIDDDVTLTLGAGTGEDMEDEVPLDSLTLQEAPNLVSSKRDVTQVGHVRRSSNPAAYPQWTTGSKANKIGGDKAGGKNHPDWHHPSNNQSPDPVTGTGAASSGGSAARPSHPIYLAGHPTRRCWETTSSPRTHR